MLPGRRLSDYYRPFLLASGLLLGLLLLPVATPPAHANAGPPRDAQGRAQKYVQHLVRFDDLSRYAKQYRFYVVGKWDKDQVSIQKPDRTGEVNYYNIPTVAQKYGVFLYAVPVSLPLKADGEPEEKWFLEPTEGVLQSSRLETVIRYNLMSDPHDTFVTRYKVVLKDMPAAKGSPAGKSLQIGLVSSGWVEPKVALLMGLPLFALLGLIGRLRSRPLS
jgi:hypothetical protein